MDKSIVCVFFGPPCTSSESLLLHWAIKSLFIVTPTLPGALDYLGEPAPEGKTRKVKAIWIYCSKR